MLSSVVVTGAGIGRPQKSAARRGATLPLMPVYNLKPPRYLGRCPDCGELRNRSRNILCRCDALSCAVCGVGWIRKPISNYYDEGDGKIWHVPYFMGMRSCPSCGASCVDAFWGRRAAA